MSRKCSTCPASEPEHTPCAPRSDRDEKQRVRPAMATEALERLVGSYGAELRVHIQLADRYLRLGDASRAARQYVTIAQWLDSRGHVAAAHQVLETGLKILPHIREEWTRLEKHSKNRMN